MSVSRCPLWVISCPARCEVMGSPDREMGDGLKEVVIFLVLFGLFH